MKYSRPYRYTTLSKLLCCTKTNTKAMQFSWTPVILVLFALTVGVPLVFAKKSTLAPVCLPDSEHKDICSCPSITFHFPRDDQNQDYVRYRSYVPRMQEATVCMWLETEDFTSEELNPLVSYATSNLFHNAYLLAFLSETRIAPYIMNLLYPGNINESLNTGEKVHLCHQFSSTQNKSDIYVNGQLVSHSSYNGAVIDGGGDLLLGQDQDLVNARGFHQDQAFSGNITNFIIWPRVLTAAEIRDVVYKCACPSDYSVHMGLDRVELYGKAYYSIPDVCPTLQ